MKIALVTLGCDKNTADAEHLAGALAARGHEVLAEGNLGRVDALVVITCGFIQAARDESHETITAFVESKEKYQNPRFLVVAGCYAQRAATELAEKYPEVDLFCGIQSAEELAKKIEGLQKDVKDCKDTKDNKTLLPIAEAAARIPQTRKRLDSRPYAFLKISDGCDHACAFCAIPGMKGPYKSIPREALLDEARNLVASGVREIVLIGQDLAPYGRDLYPDYGLPQFLTDLCKINGDFCVRLLYVYPAGLTPEFIDVLAREPKICKYIDMPLQHLDPAVLKIMRRPFAEAVTTELVRQLRERVPEIVLRTTMIVGHPGETKEAFDNLLSGVREIGFDWLGAFTYSPEDGTPAKELPGQVPAKVAEKRLDELMTAQQKITAKKQREWVGKTLRVLIDEISEDGKWALGRSYREAPEVDGLVNVKIRKGETIQPGEFYEVKITQAQVYDLIGEIEK
jgi:ribosomal protein S12 methylthiotransferase